mgnify:CR=1 FL=1
MELAVFRDHRVPAHVVEQAWWSAGMAVPFVVLWLASLLHAVVQSSSPATTARFALCTGLVRVAPAVLSLGVNFGGDISSICGWLVLLLVSGGLGYVEVTLPGVFDKKVFPYILNARYISTDLSEEERQRLRSVGTQVAANTAASVNKRADLHKQVAVVLELLGAIVSAGICAHAAQTLAHVLCAAFPPVAAPSREQLMCLLLVLCVGAVWLLAECIDATVWLLNISRLIGHFTQPVAFSDWRSRPIAFAKVLRKAMREVQRLITADSKISQARSAVALVNIANTQTDSGGLRYMAQFAAAVSNRSSRAVHYEPLRLALNARWLPPGKKRHRYMTLATLRMGHFPQLDVMVPGGGPGEPETWSVEALGTTIQQLALQVQTTKDVIPLLAHFAPTALGFGEGSLELPEFSLQATWQCSAELPMGPLPPFSFDKKYIDLVVVKGLKVVGGLLYGDSAQQGVCWEQLLSTVLPMLPQLASHLQSTSLRDVHRGLTEIVQDARQNNVIVTAGMADEQFVAACNALGGLTLALHGLSQRLQYTAEDDAATESNMPSSEEDVVPGHPVDVDELHGQVDFGAELQEEDTHAELQAPPPLVAQDSAPQADDQPRPSITSLLMGCVERLLAALEAVEKGAELVKHPRTTGTCSAARLARVQACTNLHIAQLASLLPSVLLTMVSKTTLAEDSALLQVANKVRRGSNNLRSLAEGARDASPAVDLANFLIAGAMVLFLYGTRQVSSDASIAAPAGPEGAQPHAGQAATGAGAAAASSGTDGINPAQSQTIPAFGGPAEQAARSQRAESASSAGGPGDPALREASIATTGEAAAEPGESTSQEDAVELGLRLIKHIQSTEAPRNPMTARTQIGAAAVGLKHFVAVFQHVQRIFMAGQLQEDMAAEVGAYLLGTTPIPAGATLSPADTSRSKLRKRKPSIGGEKAAARPPSGLMQDLDAAMARGSGETLSFRAAHLVQEVLQRFAAIHAPPLPGVVRELIAAQRAEVNSRTLTALDAVRALIGTPTLGGAGVPPAQLRRQQAACALTPADTASFWGSMGRPAQAEAIQRSVHEWLSAGAADSIPDAGAAAADSVPDAGAAAADSVPDAGAAATVQVATDDEETAKAETVASRSPALAEEARGLLDSFEGSAGLGVLMLVLDALGLDLADLSLADCRARLESCTAFDWAELDFDNLRTSFRLCSCVVVPCHRLPIAQGVAAALQREVDPAGSTAALTAALKTLSQDTTFPQHVVTCLAQLHDLLAQRAVAMVGPVDSALPAGGVSLGSMLSSAFAGAAADEDSAASTLQVQPIDQMKHLNHVAKACRIALERSKTILDKGLEEQVAAAAGKLFADDDFCMLAGAIAVHFGKLRDSLFCAPSALALHGNSVLADLLVRVSTTLALPAGNTQQVRLKAMTEQLNVAAQWCTLMASSQQKPPAELIKLLKQPLGANASFGKILAAVTAATRDVQPAVVQDMVVTFTDVAGRFSASQRGQLLSGEQEGAQPEGVPAAQSAHSVAQHVAAGAASTMQQLQGVYVAVIYLKLKLFQQHEKVKQQEEEQQAKKAARAARGNA